MATKVEMIQTYLQQQNIDAAFITTPDNVFYLSGFESDPHERLLGIMVFKNTTPLMICPKMEVPDAKAAGWNFSIVGHDDQEDAWEILKKCFFRKRSRSNFSNREKTRHCRPSRKNRIFIRRR